MEPGLAGLAPPLPHEESPAVASSSSIVQSSDDSQLGWVEVPASWPAGLPFPPTKAAPPKPAVQSGAAPIVQISEAPLKPVAWPPKEGQSGADSTGQHGVSSVLLPPAVSEQSKAPSD